MKKMIFFITAMLVIASACKKTDDKAEENATVLSDTITVKDAATTEAPMDSIAMQKAWEIYMTPSDIHKNLAKDNGTWTEESTMWMAPGSKPVKNKMIAVSKMILGGRYQETRHTGTFMGQPFEGVSIVGYDNASKKMVSSWIDNMGTGIMYMIAPYDGVSNTIEYKGEVTDPISGKTKSARELFTVVDDDTRKMEMFDVTLDGKEYKSMEIIMTRKK